MNTHLDPTSQHTSLDGPARQRLCVVVWVVLAGSALALTGAGDHFGTEIERGAAIGAHSWQIWGLLLPVASAIVVSGGAIWLITGSLAHIRAGRSAAIVAWSG
jgi:hypothetical protein